MDGNHPIKPVLLTAITVIAITITVVSTTSSTGSIGTEKIQAKKQHKVPDLESWPFADYDANPPADPTKRAERQRRNKKYDKSNWPILTNDVADSTVRLHQVDPELPAFPTQKSTLVVIANISNANAYLSNDKTGVYSEFTVVLEEILKNSLSNNLSAGSSVAVTRAGGRVRLPSGRAHWYGIDRQGMPRLGGRYVLFLTGESSETLSILTGYELAANKVVPLDDLKNPNQYDDADEETFLRSLRRSLANQ